MAEQSGLDVFELEVAFKTDIIFKKDHSCQTSVSIALLLVKQSEAHQQRYNLQHV